MSDALPLSRFRYSPRAPATGNRSSSAGTRGSCARLKWGAAGSTSTAAWLLTIVFGAAVIAITFWVAAQLLRVPLKRGWE